MVARPFITAQREAEAGRLKVEVLGHFSKGCALLGMSSAQKTLGSTPDTEKKQSGTEKKCWQFSDR